MASFSDFNMGIYVSGLFGEKPAFPFTYAELESAAKAKLDGVLFDYVAGGAGDEATQRGHGSAAMASRTPTTAFNSRHRRSSMATPARSPRSGGTGRPSSSSAIASTSGSRLPVNIPIASSVVIGRPRA